MSEMNISAEACLDLGNFDTPVLVFGGPYSNLRATQALRAEAERLGIPADHVICTGDVVAYAAEPAATTDVIMDWGITTVMGNCEESFGWAADDCGCGFEERTVYFALGGRRIAVVHGSVGSINEFVFEAGDDAVKRAGLDVLNVDGVIGGHSGVPFTQILDDRLWHNAGVIGMPANDGTPRVWYSILRTGPDGVEIEYAALDYDYAGAAAAMRADTLPEGYAACLESGLWPNMDVMPAAERQKVGQVLQPSKAFWPAAKRTAAE